MITFKRIRWKNFLSTGNTFTEVQLNKTDTTLILGENGAGKSTILDALTFVLFNKPYRNINLPQLVNSVNEKDCLVEIEFTNGKGEYRIVRGQAPKVFEVWKDGKLIDQEAKSRDYQKILEETILGMNYKSFCQVVILGSANYIPFMRLTAAERRAVVESILDIGVFSAMNVHLKERISANKEELTHAETAIGIARERVSALRRLVDEERRRTAHDEAWLTEQVASANATIEAARGEVEGFLKSVNNLMEQVDDRDSISDSLSRYTTLRTQISKKLQILRKEIAFYENNDTCPTCTQRIDGEFKTSTIAKGKSKADEMEDAVQKIADEVEAAETRMKDITRIMGEVQKLNTQIMRKNGEIESTQRHLQSILSKTKVEESNASADLEKAVLDEDEAVEGKRELVEEQHYLTIAGTLLKDSGIKSRIIKNYIPIINTTINKYLTNMNFFVNFQLDEEFTETIKSRHRDVFTYASFSEGEKKKIDLALLFAWRAIASMRNSITTNLLILDEILDGSLDDQATDAFLDIMGTAVVNTNTFVISHKPKELLQDKFSRCIQFVKRGNFSRAF